jgi:putative ABC transport system ATP-binding protein
MTQTATAELAGCRQVSVIHGRGPAAVQALRDVDFSVADGERVALVGRSGSGKTTLLQVLGGLVQPSAGEVSWLGNRLSTLDAAARGAVRAGGIALVFQGSNLLPTLTAEENVALAAWARRSDGRDSPPDASRLLKLVGLGEKLDALPGELSGGEAQRVAIARALAQRPRLLLCDEPTGHLDRKTGGRVLELIVTLQQRLGFALLIATHDPDVVGRCQRVVSLVDGAVAGSDGVG